MGMPDSRIDSAPGNGRGTVIAVRGCKGGVGKSVISVNFCTQAVRSGITAVALDFDFVKGGDLASLLGEDSVADVSMAVTGKGPVSGELFERSLIKTRYGMDLFPAARDALDLNDLDPRRLNSLVESAQESRQLTVVDLPQDLHSLTLGILDLADIILYVSTGELNSIRHLQMELELLATMQYPRDKLRLTLNMKSENSLTSDEVSSCVGLPVVAEFPLEPVPLTVSVNRGIPVIVGSPRSGFAKSIRSLCTRLLSDGGSYGKVHRRKHRPFYGSLFAAKNRSSGGLAGGPPDSERAVKQMSTNAGGSTQDRVAAKRLVNEKLLNLLDLDSELVVNPGQVLDRSDLRPKIERIVTDLVNNLGDSCYPGNRDHRLALVEEITDEVVGLGHLEMLLNDQEITEIMVNGPFQVYVERSGKLELTDRAFTGEAQVLQILERIVAPVGRRIDESSPMVDARLQDGSRVNGVIKPLALNGPMITIRKFPKDPLKIENLLALGSLSQKMAEYLTKAVRQKQNIIVTGGTGSGKTTLLNALSAFIPDSERIVTIEDAAELQFMQSHVVRLEARPPNIEGRGEVTIRDLVKNALRMRPDRIVVGEVRGGEALDMLQALNTGHRGSLTTAHANSPRDVLSRLETMVLMAGIDLPDRAIRDQIASAINLIVHQERFPDGSRKIARISSVNGLAGKQIELVDEFLFEETGQDSSGNIRGIFRNLKR